MPMCDMQQILLHEVFIWYYSIVLYYILPLHTLFKAPKEKNK